MNPENSFVRRSRKLKISTRASFFIETETRCEKSEFLPFLLRFSIRLHVASLIFGVKFLLWISFLIAQCFFSAENIAYYSRYS